MLINTLEIGAAILALACMFVTLMCIVTGNTHNRFPTITAICGGTFYVLFLAMARQNMNVSEQIKFSALLFAFAFFAFTADYLYRQAQQKKAVSREKFEEFRRECYEARMGVLALEA